MTRKKYPKVYLAIDNCFASKRWTQPEEWMKFAKEIGIYHVEASADNECDPLYTTPGYLKKWQDEIANASSKTGVKVSNLYSGHGTYSTLGLAHTDKSVQENVKNNWLKVMIDMASDLEAGLGFFTHAFNQDTLMDKEKYQQAIKGLVENFIELANHANGKKIKSIGVEQMYTPHQIPWTVSGAVELLQQINKAANRPFYLTIDVGHQSGQHKFLLPDFGHLKEKLRLWKDRGHMDGLWLGPGKAYETFYKALKTSGEKENRLIHEILEEARANPHLFASREDGDPYYWLENLGCYSPIVHLQQTDGKSSAHKPFTPEWNEKGIIDAGKLLNAIKCSCDMPRDNNMPAACDEIYLTIEVFSATADIPADIKNRLELTSQYWREYIPRDGETLDKLI